MTPVARIWLAGTKRMHDALVAMRFLSPDVPDMVSLLQYNPNTIQDETKSKLHELGLWSYDYEADLRAKRPSKVEPSDVQKAWHKVDQLCGAELRRTPPNGVGELAWLPGTVDLLKYQEPVMNHIAFVTNFMVDRLTYRDDTGRLQILKGLGLKEFQTIVCATIYHDAYEDFQKDGRFTLQTISDVHAGLEPGIDIRQTGQLVYGVSRLRDGIEIEDAEYFRDLQNDPRLALMKLADGPHNLLTMNGLRYKDPSPAGVHAKKQRYISARESVGRMTRGMSDNLAASDAKSGIEMERAQDDDSVFQPWVVLRRASDIMMDVCAYVRLQHGVPERQVTPADGSRAALRRTAAGGLQGGSPANGSTTRSFLGMF